MQADLAILWQATRRNLIAAAVIPMLCVRLASAQEQPAPPGETPSVQPSPAQPTLVELSRQAAELLESEGATDEALARQQAIVDSLRNLLGGARSVTAELPQAVQSQRPTTGLGGQNSPGAGTTQSGDVGGERRPGGGESSTASGSKAPENSSPLTQREGLVDAVWGHLPPRVRDELYRSYTDRFVPEYSPLLKRYFETLAESAQGRREKK